MALFSAPMTAEIAIPVCAAIGMAFSLVLCLVRPRNGDNHNDEEEGLNLDERGHADREYYSITEVVSRGAKAFVVKEYLYVGVFMVAFAILIFLSLGYVERFSTQSRPCTFYPSNMCKPALAIAVSFLLGALTSALSGVLGMGIAIFANARSGLMDRNGSFNAAVRSGAAMGFLLAAICLLGLYIAIKLFKCYYGNDWEGLFEVIAGYGLGASSMAFFGRAGGGTYAKAADVCVHLVDMMEPNIRQDNQHFSVIPYNVGDIVGDIAGMGTDLFASYAVSSCAVLVVASTSSFGIDHNFTAMCYPLLISSMGILVCLFPIVFKAYFLREVGDIRRALENQLIISTILMTVGIAIVSWIALPSSFTIYNFGSEKVVKNWQLSLCVGVGLWAGQFIAFSSGNYVRDVISFLQDVLAGSIGDHLASVCAVLTSIIIPIYADISISVSFSFADTYGIAVAALGMLSTIATRLAIDASHPISHYARRIAIMAGGINVDIARNPPPTTRKGFAIESAALVSIALFGAFVSRAEISYVDVQTPKVFIGFIGGNLIPYLFSAETMKSVGRSGLKMAEEVYDNRGHNALEYAKYFKISTYEFFWGLILPGALVMITPFLVGIIFGAETLSGVLAGSLSSVLQIANSASNAGGALNRANENIKAGVLEYAESNPRWHELLEDARNVRIFGDRLMDTSGPPLNILIQLMAVESLVFAPFFAAHRGQLFKIF